MNKGKGGRRMDGQKDDGKRVEGWMDCQKDDGRKHVRAL